MVEEDSLSSLDRIVLEEGMTPEKLKLRRSSNFYGYDNRIECYWQGQEMIGGVLKPVLVRGTIIAEDTGRWYGNGQPLYDFYFSPQASLANHADPKLSLINGERKRITFTTERIYVRAR